MALTHSRRRFAFAYILGGVSCLLLVSIAWGVHRIRASKAPIPDPSEVPEHYLAVHEAILERHRRGPVGVLFLGDSITQMWNIVPWVWEEQFGKYNPSN